MEQITVYKKGRKDIIDSKALPIYLDAGYTTSAPAVDEVEDAPVAYEAAAETTLKATRKAK